MAPITTELFVQVNYWAVLVTGLLTFFLGGLWYSPVLFEGAWMGANGYSDVQVQQMQQALGPAGFASAIIAYLVMAFAFACLIVMLGLNSLPGGLLIGGLIWIGFVASTGLTVNLFSVRPLMAWVIDGGFQLTFLLMTGGILAAWR